MAAMAAMAAMAEGGGAHSLRQHFSTNSTADGWRLKRARLTIGVFGVFGVGTDAQPLPQCDLV